MSIRIYFGDKPVIITESGADFEVMTDETGTVVIDKIDDENIQNLLNKIELPETKVGLIKFDVERSMKAISQHFTVIQAAGGFVHDGNNRILMIFRRGKWDLPKGKLDEGEDLEKCAIREVEEETGITQLTLARKLCVTYHTYWQNNERILKPSHWFLMQGNSNSALTPQVDEDIVECRWVKIDELATYMENTHPSIIDVVTKGVKAVRTYNG